MNSKRKEEMAKIVGAMLDTIAISKTSWRNHLAFSGKFYKYNFQNTLALQANNPNLTACADYSTWNSIGRRVNAGEKGILIYGENNSFTHVFDISATNSQNPPPYLWQFKDYHLEPIKDIMVEEYGEVSSEGGYKDLKASIENHVESACQRYISENNPFLVGSKIERMPIERQQAVFVATMQDSVGYMAASRLNLPQGLYNNDTLAFRYLDNFNTKQSRLLLGTAVKEIGEGILRKVELEVKTIDKKRRIENDNRRNQKNIRFTEHDNRGNNERETAETSDWQVRSDGDTVYAGERPHRAGEPSHGRKLSGTLFESGRTSLQPTGEDNGTDEETKFPTENGQLYRDGEIQQSPTYNSRGNRAKRANLHLNNAEPEGLTTTVSPFFVSKDGLYQYKVGDTVFWEGGEELVIGGVDPKSVMFGVELHRPNTNSVRFAFPVTAFESDLVRLNVNEHLRVVQEQEEKISPAYDKALEQEENEQLTFGSLPPQEPTSSLETVFDTHNLGVGSVVHLETGLSFEITDVSDPNIKLRDLSSFYPLQRAISLSEFERLYLANPLNEQADGYISDNPPKPVLQEQQQEQEEKTTEYPDFQITDETELFEGGNKTKYKNNIVAIRLLKELEEREISPTQEQQGILAKYVGWGGIPQVFDKEHSTWGGEYSELKELLSDEEYQTAKGSVLNAHYTAKEVINGVYKGLFHLGYNGGGNLLEPALGVGHFFGCIPENMKPSKLYGVELDSISGRISKQLYPSADIQIKGYEKTSFPDNFHDIAVSNVPFGNYKLSDPAFRKHNFLIHDYFFAKTLDKVRPDGLIAFITSKGTMDKQNDYTRRYLADRANFLGAIRLPNNAFKANANTEVTTDIIFLQKKSDITQEDSQSWLSLKELPDSGIMVNEYFADNPHMMLGTMEKGGGLYGNENETTLVSNGRDLGYAISQAISSLPVNVYSWVTPADVEEERNSQIPADPSVKNYGFTVVDDKIYQRENSVMLLRDDIVGIPRERVLRLIELKEQTNHVIDIQVDSCDDETLASAQKELNRLYDSFVKKHGYITSRGNSLAFRNDSDYPLLCSLEIPQEEKVFTKADVFSKRTIQPYHEVTSCDTPSEALAISMNIKGYVDIHYMSELTGITEDKITGQLDGIIFKNPAKDMFDDEYIGWETADEYLSGKVKEKLATAESHVQTENRYSANVDALKLVQPKPLEAHQIKAKLGSQWVETDDIKDFIAETLHPSDYDVERLGVSYNSFDGTWSISGKPYVSERNVEPYSVYGTERMNGYHIIDKLLNQTSISVYDTVKNDKGNDSRVLNRPATIAARDKAEQVQNAFKSWIFNDPERRERLTLKFNNLYNSERLRQYDGSHLSFPHMAPTITLEPHQVNAVARTIYGGNTLLYHCVGAGKTFTLIAAALKMKQLGIVKKPIFVVPNHIIDQWAGEFLRLYPSANVLMTTERDFEKNMRQRFVSRIATGDYDAIIIGHSQFEKIPMSAKTQQAFLDEEIDQVMQAIEDQKRESGGGDRSIIKALAGTQKRLEERFQKLVDSESKDEQIIFEKLGVDAIFVDESHNYKNLHFYTKMRDVAGISQTAAQKSTDMFLKTRFINEHNHGAIGVVFASGTAISNSMTEMYTLQKYLQYDKLHEKGLGAFDSWAGDFGETKTTLEIAASGKGLKQRRRFAKFENLPRLMQMFREFADVQTADMLNLPVPTHKMIISKSEPSEELTEIVNDLVQRSEKISKGGVDPSTDNMLNITNEGRLAALDIRLLDPTLPDVPYSKLNKAMNNIYRIWEDSEPNKSVQMVFSDLSTPVYSSQPTLFQVEEMLRNTDLTEEQQGEAVEYVVLGKLSETYTMREELPEHLKNLVIEKPRHFDVYNNIKDKLTQKGVPKHEIAFIHDAKTNKAKEKLFEKVRKGEIRILLGSTFKMGAGTNVQNKLIALHHIDVPWRPSDVERAPVKAA